MECDRLGRSTQPRHASVTVRSTSIAANIHLSPAFLALMYRIFVSWRTGVWAEAEM